MKTLETLQRKINTAEKLFATVKTMKTLAAANMKQYDKAVESLGQYHHTIELGLQAVLQDVDFSGEMLQDNPVSPFSGETQQIMAIVFGSDHGFAGRFNDDIVSFAFKILNETNIEKDHRVVICIGEQAASRILYREQPVEKLFEVPNSISGINPLIHKILLEIESLRINNQHLQVWLFYNKPAYGTMVTQEIDMIIPIELTKYQVPRSQWPSRSTPIYTIERGKLLSALIQQHIFVMLYGGAAFSLAAENASRLAAMQLASKNIEELLVAIQVEFRQNRQNAITEELLDIAAGAMAFET